MSIDTRHLRDLISEVLVRIGLYSIEARELLMLTSAQESHCGEWIHQLGSGPALGIFQMEPATLHDLYENYLKYHQDLEATLDGFTALGMGRELNLKANLPFQIVSARFQYLRKPGGIPRYDDIWGLAGYYKQHWNTEKGDATPEEAVRNYKLYAS
jgi:hypothetical protein